MDTKHTRKWLVVTREEYDNLVIDWNSIKETDANHVRWNNDESECILAYHGAKPSFLSNITGVINHGEVLELLLTSDWVSPDEDEI